MARKYPRWAVVGGVVAVLGGGVAVLLKRTFFATYKYEEEPLGEPYAYSAAGSGTGWPLPQRGPDNTETVSGIAGTMPQTETADAGSAPVSGREGPTSSAVGGGEPERIVVTATDAAGAGSSGEHRADMDDLDRTLPLSARGSAATGRLTAETSPSGTAAADRSQGQTGSPAPVQGSAAYPPGAGSDVGPTVPSEPPVRPAVPFTEQQAEMNARLQLKQEDLLHAFPGITREQIVESDGDLDRLAVMLAASSGANGTEVRRRLESILGLATDADEGISPDLTVNE